MALTTPDPTFYPLFLLVIPPPIGGSFDWTEGRLAVGVNPCPWAKPSRHPDSLRAVRLRAIPK